MGERLPSRLPKNKPEFEGPEAERRPRKAYLFDVDGVLTDPEAKRVEQPEIFAELAKRLEHGLPIGLNTGRSIEFIKQEILAPLESQIGNTQALQILFAIGEKGGVWITYDANGKQLEQIDETTRVGEAIQDEVRTLVTQSPYAETMFYDATKRTMVSIELLPTARRPQKSFKDFQAAQTQLVEALQGLLVRHGKDKDLRVDPTRIATDVEHRRAGKALGARKFVELLQERGIEPEAYLGFGDSVSDYDMHEELQRLGKKSQFIFVSERERLAGKEADVIFTTEQLDKGTIEFLQEENKSLD